MSFLPHAFSIDVKIKPIEFEKEATGRIKAISSQVYARLTTVRLYPLIGLGSLSLTRAQIRSIRMSFDTAVGILAQWSTCQHWTLVVRGPFGTSVHM